MKKLKIRNTWGYIKPFTRIKGSKKIYNRKKVKSNNKEF